MGTSDFTLSRRTIRALAFAAMMATSLASTSDAGAAPCAGFTDVDHTSQFCGAVEWMRNRAITLGCTTTTYCPDAAVSRLAMAAFMQRLGDALTPVRLGADTVPGTIDLDANLVACQTPDLVVTGFPRTAYADATLGATAAADVTFAADLVYSTDAGANWIALHPMPNRGSTSGAHWTSVADVGVREIDVGETIRFGTRVSRGGASGSANLSDSRCRVRVLVFSRTGSESPLGASAAARSR